MNDANTRKGKALGFSASKSSDANKAYNRIVRLLARRDHSIKELTDKLTPYYTAEATDAAIEKATPYIKPPEELARQLAAGLHRRHRGQLKIALELQKRGLPALNADSEQELEKARVLMDKLLQKAGSLETFAERMKLKQKAFRFLQSRGFDFETISETIRQTLNEKF